MIKINKNKKEVSVVLKERFYPEKNVSEAIKDFQDICSIKKNKEELILKPKSDDVELETIGYEFCNYVLGLINNEKGDSDE